MNRYAAIALNFAAIFLIVMALLVDSPSLFYMATAIIVTLLASRIQAWLAVRYLRFERYSPPAVRVGELVTVEVIVWSERRLKRPLVYIVDQLPLKLITQDRTQSLPVAPSYDQPIRTHYSFRPTRRGKYRWDQLIVVGTDALGLVTMRKTYTTEPAELTVYPVPLPVTEELRPMVGWGASDIDSGRRQGVGLEPKGIREYVSGDPLRYIHWRSSARSTNLMIKEFETGSGVALNIILQRSEGSDIGDEQNSTFEAMCSHAMFLAADYSKKGAIVTFPMLEDPSTVIHEHAEARIREVRELLTTIDPYELTSISEEVRQVKPRLPEGSTIVLTIAQQDPALPQTIQRMGDSRIVCLVYDASEYAPLPPSYQKASDPSYIDALERSGAFVVTMPRKEVVKT